VRLRATKGSKLRATVLETGAQSGLYGLSKPLAAFAAEWATAFARHCWADISAHSGKSLDV
jgi:hypothetical protein